jgi:phosphoribosylglycinamide formyltransferase 1
MRQINIGFMSSHGGTNMQAVLDAIQKGILKAKPCVLISNNSKSKAIERAKSVDMPHYHISQVTHPDPIEHDHLIVDTLKKHEVEYILLVGYMKKLGPHTLKQFSGKIINIHPSLLPKYGGNGMFGRYVHEAVLRNNETESGVTIHLVDEEYDTGRIINQCTIPILVNETVDSLSERILHMEHEILVETLIKISTQEIVL